MKKIKQQLLVAFCIFGFGTVFGQSLPIISPEVYASAGSFDIMPGGASFSWTIGEAITETSSLSNPVVFTQGFQQPKWTQFNVGINEFESESGWNIFPNPAKDAINITYTNGNHNQVSIELFDMFGKLLQSRQVDGGFISEQLDVSQFASGSILLRITNNKGEKLKSCIIIKN